MSKPQRMSHEEFNRMLDQLIELGLVRETEEGCAVTERGVRLVQELGQEDT